MAGSLVVRAADAGTHNRLHQPGRKHRWTADHIFVRPDPLGWQRSEPLRSSALLPGARRGLFFALFDYGTSEPAPRPAVSVAWQTDPRTDRRDGEPAREIVGLVSLLEANRDTDVSIQGNGGQPAPHCASPADIDLLRHRQQKRQGDADRLWIRELDLLHQLSRCHRHLRAYAFCRT